jgi:hypothetical protein
MIIEETISFFLRWVIYMKIKGCLYIIFQDGKVW